MNIYDYQRLLGKIEDIPALRNVFIALYDARNKEDMVRFGLLLGHHLLEMTGYEPCGEIQDAFAAMQRWLDKKANYHEARNIAFSGLYQDAREENNPVKERFFRTMAQSVYTPL